MASLPARPGVRRGRLHMQHVSRGVRTRTLPQQTAAPPTSTNDQPKCLTPHMCVPDLVQGDSNGETSSLSRTKARKPLGRHRFSKRPRRGASGVLGGGGTREGASERGTAPRVTRQAKRGSGVTAHIPTDARCKSGGKACEARARHRPRRLPLPALRQLVRAMRSRRHSEQARAALSQRKPNTPRQATPDRATSGCAACTL